MFWSTSFANFSRIDFTDVSILTVFKASRKTAKKQSPAPSLSTISYLLLLKYLLTHTSLGSSS